MKFTRTERYSRLEYERNSDIMTGLNTNPVLEITENYGYKYRVTGDWKHQVIQKPCRRMSF